MSSINQAIDSYFVPTNSISGVRPNAYSGSSRERVDDFLASFNVYAKIHKWDDAIKCEGLVMFLSGRAKLWYGHIRRLAAEGKVGTAAASSAGDGSGPSNECKTEEARVLTSSSSALKPGNAK